MVLGVEEPDLTGQTNDYKRIPLQFKQNSQKSLVWSLFELK